MTDATISAAPAQHKQPSRKGKKAWRKNVDVTEINEGLDEVREQVIKHGGIIAEKTSDELFITDTTGSLALQTAHARGSKPLKADEILAQRSAVPALHSYKRSADPTAPASSLKKLKKDYVSGKELERLRKIAYGGDSVHKDVIKSGVDAEYDPWGEDEPAQKPEYSFLEQKKLTREPRTLKRAPISMAKSGKPIAAVRKPEKGKSYNPVFEDWQALVAREGDKAVAEEQIRLDEEAKDEAKQVMIEKAQAEPEKDAWESEWESEWEGIMSEKEDNGEDKAWLRKKRPERKTPAERNKIKRRKLASATKIHEGNMKTRDLEAARIRQLAKELDARIKQEAERTAFPESDADSSDGEDEIVLRKGLGRAAIPDARLEVVLADELEDSLRRLRPEGNLMQDRFRSMILRGKIESRNKITQPKKPKREVKEKWGYKDWRLK